METTLPMERASAWEQGKENPYLELIASGGECDLFLVKDDGCRYLQTVRAASTVRDAISQLRLPLM